MIVSGTVAAAVAALESVIDVPLAMVAMVVPGRMPAPDTLMPTARSAVLAMAETVVPTAVVPVTNSPVRTPALMIGAVVVPLRMMPPLFTRSRSVVKAAVMLLLVRSE